MDVLVTSIESLSCLFPWLYRILTIEQLSKPENLYEKHLSLSYLKLLIMKRLLVFSMNVKLPLVNRWLNEE